MKTSLTAIFLLTIGIVLADGDVARKFEAAGLTPNPVKEAPTKLFEVKYGNKNVNLGNKFGATEVSTMPKIDYESENCVFYTLVMIGPNPLRLQGSDSQVLHWLVGNIPENRVSEGVFLANYLMPIPIPVLLGKQRYIFLLYEQNQGRIEFDTTDYFAELLPARVLFDINDFVKKYNFGAPLAGNFLLLGEILL